MIDWTTLTNLTIDGIRNGSMYGLLGVCIVLVCMTSDTINFAIPYLGLSGAMLLELLSRNGTPPIPAYVAAFLCAITLGLATQFTIYRYVQSAPAATRMIASLGVATCISSIATALWGMRDNTQTFPFLESIPSPIGQTQIMLAPADVATFLIAVVTAISIHLFLRRTRVGIALRAAAERPREVALFGVQTTILQLITSVLTASLATLAAICLAATSGNAGPNGMDNAFFWALLAAMLASFSNLWGALVAGILLGVLDESLQLIRVGWLDLSLYHVPALYVICLAIILLRRQGLFKAARYRRI